MRVTGGSFRGVRLRAPRGMRVRPSGDRAREGLFSLLGRERVADMQVLDLFAGAGTLGIEALSRGARGVVFVDRSRQALASLADNIERCLAGREEARDLARSVRLVHRRISPACQLPPSLFHPSPGLVFLDPPYDQGLELPCLDALAGLLRPGAVVVVETRQGRSLPERRGSLRRDQVRQYGEELFILYTVAGD